MQTEEPAQLLRVDGRACNKFRNTEQYAALEALDGFIAWNGRADNMIDRFDGRALLDFYREPDDSVRKRPKTEAQLELEEVSHPAVGPAASLTTCKLANNLTDFTCHPACTTAQPRRSTKTT